MQGADDDDTLAYVRGLQDRAAELSLTVDVGTWRPTDRTENNWPYDLAAVRDGDELIGFISDGADGARLLRDDKPVVHLRGQ